MSNFHSLRDVDRGSETQLLVDDNLKSQWGNEWKILVPNTRVSGSACSCSTERVNPTVNPVLTRLMENVIPCETRRRSSCVPTSGQRRRRWPDVGTQLDRRLVFSPVTIIGEEPRLSGEGAIIHNGPVGISWVQPIKKDRATAQVTRCT